MKAGFAKVDITPRIGVELCGFGPYLHRYSIAVRDNLWAKAFAIENSGKRIVLVSCDLIGLQDTTINKVKSIVREESGLSEDAIMVHCTHTHSGPATAVMIGWGEMDAPYLEILPYKIAKACTNALASLKYSKISYAKVPCEGISYNRQYDKMPSMNEALKDKWQPVKPELTDTACHVIRVEAKGKITGFLSYYGCHPVVCCEQSRYIHGDYSGVALNNLERELGGATGIFLQGAQGDINTCVVHCPEQESLRALDIIAARFANSVRYGLKNAKPVKVEEISSAIIEKRFTEQNIGPEILKSMLAEKESILQKANADAETRESRMTMVYIRALRKIISIAEKESLTHPAAKIQGFKIGSVELLGAPFEIYHAIKREVEKKAKSKILLVMSVTNGYFGYAPDKKTTEGYAAKTVPMILGYLPLKKIHEELVDVFLELSKKLSGNYNE